MIIESSIDVYSKHLSLGVGPVIRIGTPVTDLSLSELPSPRGIKEDDCSLKIEDENQIENEY